MSGFVLDASVAGVWLFDDESHPRADSVLARLEDEGALVPQHWHLEVRNTLIVGERRGRILAAEVDERLIGLSVLPVRTDTEVSLNDAYALARAHSLTLHDAVYLELARRQGLPLATLDVALGQAAAAEDLSLVE